MVRLSKIITKTGDGGETGLSDGSRVPKSSPRVHAYGEVDELNSAIGLAVSLGAGPAEALARIQNELFDLGADLSSPGAGKGRVSEGMVDALEADAASLNEDLEPLTSFVLPGGPAPAAALHLARAVCRRAERACWALAGTKGEEVAPATLKYLNRLSDLLFIMARVACWDGEVLWEPREK
ncbi:cob(I)yrinic acid a,c-diamide adenosyltransferase [bacterium]|nr:cob(I)yrinic acid a,c-diamide adenosyltransferase [bacterium]